MFNVKYELFNTGSEQDNFLFHELFNTGSEIFFILGLFLPQSKEYDTAVDRTFIASAQSPDQQALIAEHPADSPVYVEGGFKVWLREVCLTYFVLRSEVTQTFTTFHENKDKEEEETDSE